jgi:hypothetical protein
MTSLHEASSRPYEFLGLSVFFRGYMRSTSSLRSQIVVNFIIKLYESGLIFKPIGGYDGTVDT